jgi:hypothetical protein
VTGRTQVISVSRDGSNRVPLGFLGQVSGLSYDYTCPGGPNQANFTLNRTARFRTNALDAGRIIHLIRGGSVIWDGDLDEPDATSGVIALAAHGSGTFGTDLMAYYPGPWSAAQVDAAVNLAISRGLRWVNPGIGTPAGMFTGQKIDPASVSLTDLLNNATQKGGLTWYVNCRPRGNVVSVFPLPTVPGRILVSTAAAARTLFGTVNTIWARYQSTSPSGVPAGFNTVSTVEQASIDKYGPKETFDDLSSTGVTTAANVQAVDRQVLNNYQRAMFAGAFSVRQGELMNMGGQRVDAGSEQAGGVCKLMLTDYGWGGEIKPGPISFLVGGYAWDDEQQLGAVTPFQSVRHDIAALLGMAVPRPAPDPWKRLGPGKVITSRSHF